MTEEDASVEYWRAVNKLQEVIESEHRGNKENILGQLEDDLIGG